MSEESSIPEKAFSVEIAKQTRAVCKKCKQKCLQGELRIAKLVPSTSKAVKPWYHVKCIFEAFLNQRQTTKRIESPHDIEGWELLDNDDKSYILKQIKECNKMIEANKLEKPSNKKQKKPKGSSPQACISEDSLSMSSDMKDPSHRDNSFQKFRIIVANITNKSSSNDKIAILRDFFSKGSDKNGFKGDISLWCKLLLPSVVKRCYNLQTSHLIKIFSRIFQITEDTIKSHLVSGDLGQTIHYFFEQSKLFHPVEDSTLTIYEVNDFLELLTSLKKEEDQVKHFTKFIEKCKSNDLKVVLRLIKHDLRMNAGAEHVFKALHPDAYLYYQSCKDINSVIATFWGNNATKSEVETPKSSKRSRKASSTTKIVKKLKMDDDKKDTDKSESAEKIEAAVEGADVTATPQTISETSPLIPNYFHTVKLLLEDGVKERYAELVRYFIAYGGTVLTPDEYEQSTHVLHLKDTISEPSIQCARRARHVIIEWIKDTVEKASLQDYRPYTVRWKPSAHVSP